MPMIPDTHATAKASRETALREAMRAQPKPSHFKEDHPSPRKRDTSFVNSAVSAPSYPVLTHWRIRPCVVGAAWREFFEFITELTEPYEIKNALWDELPLNECGWKRNDATLLHLHDNRWQLERPITPSGSASV